MADRPTSTEKSEGRYNELVNRYTARQLAMMLASTEALFQMERERATGYHRVLWEIAHGHYTPDGAILEAESALKP